MIRGMLSAYSKRKRYLLHFEFQNNSRRRKAEKDVSLSCIFLSELLYLLIMFSCLCVNLYIPQFYLFSAALVELVYWSVNNQRITHVME